VDQLRLGRTTLELSAIGFGAFKIGRNTGVKYPTPYDLPDDEHVHALLHGLRALGVTYIDTAPAYGISEQRLGAYFSRHDDGAERPIISTKVGETFDDGVSTYDYSRIAVDASLARSRARLGVDRLDLVFVHSNGDDLAILRETDVVEALRAARDDGAVRCIGFSGKTVDGARAALDWADALMVMYHPDDTSHDDVMHAARERGVGIVVKKALASGRIDPSIAIPFALNHPAVTSVVIGGLDLDHMRDNVAHAVHARTSGDRRGDSARNAQ